MNKHGWKDCSFIQTAKGSKEGGREGLDDRKKKTMEKMKKQGDYKEGKKIESKGRETAAF